MKKATAVDEYIADAPKEIQPKLKQLRAIITETAPDAIEKISYGMPYYGYKGRLIYFAYARNHIGIYLPTPVLEEHAQDLKKYSTSKATVRFPLDQELPVTLIKKLIKARIKKNEAL